eukprot:COSAG01_NODE_9195_length_2523_cov_27.632990_3_plen_134_part_00
MVAALIITTLTGKQIELDEEDSTPLSNLKESLQDQEGIPPDQQTWWFSVSDETEGAQQASAFSWWSSTEKQLDDEVRNLFTAGPLKQFKDDATLGDVKAAQGGAETAKGMLVLLTVPKRTHYEPTQFLIMSPL